MELILKSPSSDFKNKIYFDSLPLKKEMLINPNDKEESLNASLFTYEKTLVCHELLEIKKFLEEADIKLTSIFSSSRETILSAKSLKINSFLERHHQLHTNNKKEDLIYEGTVRSGVKICSNGNLFIIGDVNPGSILTADKNIYVWGKLCGIAIAGKNGDKSSTISSLYLNPLQLRICDIIALGPKEKPKKGQAEIAILEKESIVIKPYLINK